MAAFGAQTNTTAPTVLRMVTAVSDGRLTCWSSKVRARSLATPSYGHEGWRSKLRHQPSGAPTMGSPGSVPCVRTPKDKTWPHHCISWPNSDPVGQRWIAVCGHAERSNFLSLSIACSSILRRFLSQETHTMLVQALAMTHCADRERSVQIASDPEHELA